MGLNLRQSNLLVAYQSMSFQTQTETESCKEQLARLPLHRLDSCPQTNHFLGPLFTVEATHALPLVFSSGLTFTTDTHEASGHMFIDFYHLGHRGQSGCSLPVTFFVGTLH